MHMHAYTHINTHSHVKTIYKTGDYIYKAYLITIQHPGAGEVDQ